MSEQTVGEEIGRFLQARGLLPRQPRYRYWETEDGWQFLYTTEKVEDDQGRERFQSAVYQAKGPGSQSGPKHWTKRTRMVLRSERSHVTRKAAKARAYKMFTDHRNVLAGRKIQRAAAQEGATA